MDLKWLIEQRVMVALVLVFVALVLASVALYGVDLLAYSMWIKSGLIGSTILLVTVIVKLKNKK